MVPEEFYTQVLPNLSAHYLEADLESLEKRSPWLKSLRESKGDLDEAVNEFFKNGSDFLSDLSQHIDLLETSGANYHLTRQFIYLFILFMRELNDQKGLFSSSKFSPKTSTSLQENEPNFLQNKIQEMKEKGSDEDSIIMSEAYIKAGQAMLEHPNDIGSEESEATLKPQEICFQALKLAKQSVKHPPVEDESILLQQMHAAWVKGTGSPDTEPESEILKQYNQNIQAVTNRITCTKALQLAKDNLEILRRFQARRNPCIAEPQAEIRRQRKKISEQQEVITALTFRFILEHLSEKVDDHTASGRWRKLWETACRNECRNPSSDHALNGLILPKALNTSGEFSKGKEGLIYRQGHDLYSILSHNIHNYNGGGKDAFLVRDDQWGSPIRSILEALIPQNFDENGEVEWEEERKRYLD